MNPETVAPLYSHPNIPTQLCVAGGYGVLLRTHDRRGVSVWMNPHTEGPEGLRYVVHENTVDPDTLEFLKISFTKFETESASAVTEYIDELVERYLEPAKLSDMMYEVL